MKPKKENPQTESPASGAVPVVPNIWKPGCPSVLPDLRPATPHLPGLGEAMIPPVEVSSVQIFYDRRSKRWSVRVMGSYTGGSTRTVYFQDRLENLGAATAAAVEFINPADTKQKELKKWNSK